MKPIQYIIVFVLSLCLFYVLGTVFIYERSLIHFTVENGASSSSSNKKQDYLLAFKAKRKEAFYNNVEKVNKVEVEEVGKQLDDDENELEEIKPEMMMKNNDNNENIIIEKKSFLPHWKPGDAFGERNQYRASHEKARFENKQMNDFLPFNETLVASSVRKSTRLEVEVEYFRFQDEFGLIDTGWDDFTVLSALQALVDIWAQANIWLKIRKSEALSYVTLSRQRKEES